MLVELGGDFCWPPPWLKRGFGLPVVVPAMIELGCIMSSLLISSSIHWSCGFFFVRGFKDDFIIGVAHYML